MSLRVDEYLDHLPFMDERRSSRGGARLNIHWKATLLIVISRHVCRHVCWGLCVSHERTYPGKCNARLKCVELCNDSRSIVMRECVKFPPSVPSKIGAL